MSIIAKMCAMLALDSVAFDSGMTKARSSLRNFGGETEKMNASAFRLAGGFFQIHTAARLIGQAATFGTVLAQQIEKGTMAAEDFAEAAYKIPLGIGEAIKATAGLGYEITGEAAAVRQLTAETEAFVAQIAKLGQARKELEAIAAIGQEARAGSAMIGLEGLDKTLAEIEAKAAKKRKDVAGHASAGTLGALGYAGPTAAKSALEDIEKERAAAEAFARRQDAIQKAEGGWSELTKANMAYEKLRLSAGDYRRLELSMLDTESSMIDEIVQREAAVEALAAAQERLNAEIDAAYPDIDLTFFDQYLAGQKELADQADALKASLRSPWQALQVEIDRCTLLLEKGLIGQEDFNAAVTRAGKGAVEAAGGLSPNRGQAAIWNERRQYGALQGDAQTVPSLLRQQLKEVAGVNRGVQKLLDAGGLG